jgi:hypothetical protein
MNETKVCNLRLKIVYSIELLAFYIPVDATRDQTMMVESQASWESYCNFESHLVQCRTSMASSAWLLRPEAKASVP